MSRPRAKVDVVSKDKGLEKILAMAKRVGKEKPYAKAGVIGVKAEQRHPTELEEANHKAAKEQAKFAGEKAPARHASGPSNIELALIHEFGAPSAGIPERSFIRSSFDKHADKYQRLCNVLIRQVYEGTIDERRALGFAGVIMATDMKLGITTGAGIGPANAPATLARKLGKGKWNRRGGKNKTQPRALVDTGQLVGSISWEVVAGEAKVEEGEPA